jgi:hypothetical protein
MKKLPLWSAGFPTTVRSVGGRGVGLADERGVNALQAAKEATISAAPNRVAGLITSLNARRRSPVT